MSYCKVCGKKLEETGDICRACQDQIRAEALGRKKERTRETDRRSGSLDSRERESGRENQEEDLAKDEGEKKPHHFKSMADYLEYLKKRR